MQENPYAVPQSDLVKGGENGAIDNFKRFSAWAVFGLSIITFGIYPLYWLYTRAIAVNSNHNDKIQMIWLHVAVVSTILSTVLSFFENNETLVILSLVASLVYFVTYLTSLYKVRNRLQVIINDSGVKAYKLGPVLTFFFSAIYLQYKINECIDDKASPA